MIQDVATLKGDVSAMNRRLGDQAKQQDERHRDNQDRFRGIENQIEEVRSEVAELKSVIVEAKGVLEGLRTAAHILKWLLGVAIALQTLYMLFGPAIRRTFDLPNAKATQPTTQGKAVDPSQFNAQQ